MRKPFAAVMVLVLLLSGILPATQPISTQPVSAYAPPPPTPSAPTPSAAGPGIAGQSLPTPPSPDDLPPEMEEARARQAIEAVLEKHMRYWGPRYRVAPVEVTVEGEWAHGVARWRSQTRTLDEPIHILAHRLPDGTWQALMPGTDGLYLQWLDAMPGGLVPAGEKSQLRTQAAEADALRRPQATPVVPSAATVTLPDKEGPSEPLELALQPIYPTPTSMQQVAPLGPEEARQAALAQIKIQVDRGHAPLWNGATLGDSIPLYDLSGEITAYLFPVGRGETPAGYLTVAALHLPNPVLEFSTEGFTPLYGALDLAERKSYQLTIPQRPLYLGLLTYGYELVGPSTGRRLVLDLLTSGAFSVTKEEARVPLRQRIQPEVMQSQTPTQILGYALISGVPDWNQFWGSYGCYSGCSPTSGVNVMGYWDGHSYDNLIYGSDWQGAVNEMRSHMGTWCTPDGGGATNIGNISPGISSYAQAHGYTFVSELWCNGCATSSTYDGYRAEINGNRPIVVDVLGHSTYRDHSVAGVGYETNGSYMIVHDNWSSTGENVYLQYGSGYSSIYMHPVVPGSGEQVKLWSLANYEGSVMWSGGTGFSNGPNADSYSMEIPGGWSVKTWRGDNRSGEKRCWSESVHNLQDHGWHLAIQSIEVFNSDVCPPPGGQVELWSLANYDGSVVWSGGTGFSNDPNADSYSMKIPSGWSVKTWREDNRGGEKRCWSESVPNLQDHGWHLAIRSIEVFDSDVCPPPGTPPDPPSLSSPSNGATLPQDTNITLDWNSSSGATEYYAHLWGGPSIDISSGWRDSTSWYIGQQWPGTYQWQVKARNQYGESGWSSTWSFTVSESDTTPPTGRITSPSDGAVIGTCPLTIQAEASDDQSGVSHVEFHAWYDGSWHHFGDDYTSPYSWNWDCSSVSDQGVWLTIHIWDNAGNEVMDPGGYVYITLSLTTIGPLVYDSHTVDDDNNGQSSGDGDGVVECGETIELYVTLRNMGDGTATGVNAAISTSDPYVTWLYNTDSAYPDISGGGTGTNSNDFDFAVASTTPHGHIIQFDLNINASNGGPWSDSFSVSVACPWPDLVPSQWGGWPYPIIPSSITGTTEVNTLYANYPTYIDWGISNSGNADCGGDAYGDLYFDDTLLASYNFGDVQAGWTWAFFDWPSIVVDTPGWHTLKFVADPDGLIAESDETNNVWQRDFYWTPSAPYADDMENGTNDWTATGLWHQVDASSAYPESHSWSHSWWYGQDASGDYDTGMANSGDLTSPPVYIPSTGYYLRFWYRYETETQGQGWDQRWVQISVDGGPFENVLQLFDDPMSRWLQSPAIDLSGYASHTIQVRFHFDTIDSSFNDYRGWYIDDFDISATPPPSCADSHEPNDTPAEATVIAYGQSLDADICPGGDYDFYTFTGTEGDKVVIDVDAKADGSLLDPYIFLLDSDGTSVLAENDDEILVEIQDSHLGYQLPHDGTFYVKVKAWDHPSAGSADHFYSIHLLTDDVSPSAEITSPGHDSWLDPNLQTVTTDVSDDESGIRNVTFYWHDADWDNSDWIVLEDDRDPRDGWTYDFDTSGIPEQSQDCVVFIYAYDWAGNYIGYGSYHLGIDRTPPTVTAGVQQMYGDAPFRDFWVHWWDSYDDASGIASYDVQYRDGAGGMWTDLAINTTETYTRFVGLDSHTYYFRARARDLAGNQSAYTGGDGDAQHTVDVCDTTPDAYEADNSAGSAQWITPDGFSQIHNMHTEGDQDWVKFYAEAGITYTLATGNTGGHADTVLSLYGTDGSTLIDSNDDYPGMWPSSRLDWQPTSSGVYYVKVEHWDPWAYGCTTEYGLSITTNRTPSLELGEPGLSFRYVETFGVTGEPYPADANHLNNPHSVAVDNTGNLYVTETDGQRLLKFNSDGVFQWSVGMAGVSGWGNDHFDHPLKVAVDNDSGQVYVADVYAHRVQVFDTDGNYVKTIGVTGESGFDNDHFNEPKGVAVDAHGNIYVADTMNHRIQIFNSAGVYSTTLGTGQGTGNYQFNEPESVAFDSAGNIYVADYRNHRVQIFTPGLIYSATLGVSGEAGNDNAHFDRPNTIALDEADNIYVADMGNHRVQKINSGLNWVATLGETDVIGSDNEHFHYPNGVAIDPNTGDIYVSDGLNCRIQKFDSSLNYVSTLGVTGVPYQTDNDHFNRPADVATDSSGNIFLVEEGGHRLLKLDSSGAVQAVVGTAGIAGDDNEHFSDPFGLAVDDSGRVYVADKDNHRVQIFDNNLNYLDTIGSGYCGTGDDEFCGPHKVAVDADDNIYVVDTWNERVQVFDSSHNHVATLGITDEQGDDNNHFREPRGVAVDTAGNVYVADLGNVRVQKCSVVGTSGVCTTFIGKTGVIGDDFNYLRAPLDVAVDTQSRVYVCDSWWNQRIQVFDNNGAYLTTIGGEWGEKSGQFRNPAGIGVDADGDIYVADTDNARIQKFTPGVSNWQQVNINGFGDKDRSGGGISLRVFGDYLYAGLGGSSGGQVWRTADDISWAQVTGTGFGNVDNTFVKLGATFNGYLYAGTWNETTGCEIYRSNDGLSWNRVASGGFGDGNNTGVGTMAVFDDYLYVSTYNGSTGAELWRTPDGTNWVQVSGDGFGDANNVGAWSMAVFDDVLHVGTQNFETGAELWQTSNGTGWEQVNTDGFGDPHNQWPSFAVYDDYLYIGFANDSTDTYEGTGTQIWRSVDGTSWDQVVGDGFGDATNGGSDTLVVFGPCLYSGTYNRESGTQLRRTTDGVHWTKVASDGFGDGNNYSTYGNATFNDRLFLATANEANGAEVWRSALQLAKADFSATPTSGVVLLTVDFTNQSTGDYDTCAWDFGDGGTSSDCSNPSHGYTLIGVYTVTLTVSGLGGTDTLIRTNYITVYEPAQADFSASPTSGVAPLTVAFTNQSTGDYDTCSWDFGDGGTSSDCSDPSHDYTSSGVYAVSLTVSGPGGSDTETKAGYITVYEAVDADFSGSPTSGMAPLTVAFTNQSTGDYDTCAWDFGDGGTSTDCSDPSHGYTSVGVYTVTLMVSGLGGTDTLIRTNYITVYEPAQADFSASPTSGVAPLTVAFTNQSTGDYDTCSWDFGDGGTSSDCSDPSHDYTSSGVYAVSLTVSGPGGSDTETKAGYITVYEAVDADFSGSPTSGMAPLTVAFTNQSTGDYDTCAWDFGDGGTSTDCSDPSHGYTSVGVYTVTLMVNGPGGSDIKTKAEYITVKERYDVYLPLVVRNH